jgi:hypothetical protein
LNAGKFDAWGDVDEDYSRCADPSFSNEEESNKPSQRCTDEYGVL